MSSWGVGNFESDSALDHELYGKGYGMSKSYIEEYEHNMLQMERELKEQAKRSDEVDGVKRQRKKGVICLQRQSVRERTANLSHEAIGETVLNLSFSALDHAKVSLRNPRVASQSLVRYSGVGRRSL